MELKNFFKKLLPYRIRRLIKKSKRKFENWVKKGNIKKSTIEDIKELLVDGIGIKKGDNLIISSSFGNLNADFSPKDLIVLLQNIVGSQGNIVMPFYPPGNSYEWARQQKVFHMRYTKSSTGVLTQVFSEMPGVFKSKHPTKAVVAWGKNAKEITEGHEYSRTPFYWDSPYGWLLKNESKSLGLGLKNMPIFHSLEDIILESEINLYQKDKKQLSLIDFHGREHLIEVLVHDPEKINELVDIGDYVRLLNLSTYHREEFGYAFCYVVNNKELFKVCEKEFKNGNFRFK